MSESAAESMSGAVKLCQPAARWFRVIYARKSIVSVVFKVHTHV